ncbi:MAG: ABC transporter ATP-binding protein [Dehalococcoidia bacterium]|jgi:ABC-2 type transport system ATP-binding protein|nr:MAG: ABC-2 type transport system ATP-binding protein [Chloroflexota bacterium]
MSIKNPLSIINFSKNYDKFTAVDNLTLEINTGEIFGFLGPNGAGKSTTIRTILNFIFPSNGSINIFGLDSVQDAVQLKKHIGYLAGDIALYEEMTGDQILNYLADLQEDTDWDYVKDLVKRLDASLYQPIKTLSKGNKQKIGLIQAFMNKPNLLILDEPTSGLDPLMKQVFYEMVLEMKQAGKSIFISSHDLTEIQKVCDRVGFIREGKLIAIEDLYDKNSMNFKKYKVQFEKKINLKKFTIIEGLKSEYYNEDTLIFTVTGSIDIFIKAIARYKIITLDEQETSLEDVFMQYYEKEVQ